MPRRKDSPSATLPVFNPQPQDLQAQNLSPPTIGPLGFFGHEGVLATLSHEIRTPLNGVLGMAELLSGTDLNQTQRSYLTTLQTSGEHLLNLVNEILDLAQWESGQIRLAQNSVNIETLLEDVSEILSPIAHRSGLEFAWAMDHHVPLVLADGGRLRQILFNLAGNAVKLTATYKKTRKSDTETIQDGVVLSAQSFLLNNSQVRLKISIKDTGPGIKPEDRDRLCDAFFQSQDGMAAGGAGLGLTIVRHIVAAMGGTISIRNLRTSPSDYWGAEFSFTADFAIAETETFRVKPLTGRTLALISKNLAVREATLTQIRACGARGVTVAGFDSLNPCYDAVLIDVPVGQKEPILRPPSYLAAFALLAPEDRERIEDYRNLGYRGYLIKPLRRSSIISRLYEALGVEESLVVKATPHLKQGIDYENQLSASPPSFQNKRILVAEDNPINALLAKTQLDKLGCLIEIAATGKAALSALQSQSYDFILMDLRLPDQDGLSLARQLREKGCLTPIIAFTANAFEEDRQACFAAGMQGFLTKPLVVSDLIRTLGCLG